MTGGGHVFCHARATGECDCACPCCARRRCEIAMERASSARLCRYSMCIAGTSGELLRTERNYLPFRIVTFTPIPKGCRAIDVSKQIVRRLDAEYERGASWS